MKHAVLLGGGQARVQRQDFGVPVAAPLQRQMRIADLALAGQEDQHVATTILARDLVQRRSHLLGQVGLAATLWRPPAQLHRMAAPFHLDHRRTAEMLREARGVQRGRSDDELEIGPSLQQALQITQQEIDVEAALVCLVQHQRVVRRQGAITLGLGQQDAVGHELDQRTLAHLLVEAHLETDQRADLGVQLLSHAPRHRARGQAPWLRATDHAGHAASCGQAQLGQLRGLARTGLAGQDQHLVRADGGDDVRGVARDRQGCIHRALRHAGGTRGAALLRGVDVARQRRQFPGVRRRAERAQPHRQPLALARQHRFQPPAQLAD